MKRTKRLLFLLSLWFIVLFGTCHAEPAETFYAILNPNSIPQHRKPFQTPPPSRDLDPFTLGDPSDTITNPLEPLASLRADHSPFLVVQKREEDSAILSEPGQSGEPADTIADPLEPLNRVFFHLNDKLYFWVLKPVASAYGAVVPEDLRIGVDNFFSNITTPVRLVNCLLQINFKCVGNETIRFILNTALGMAGFLDPARKELGIEKQDEDFGQTLGFWGIEPAFYIEWPILGASSLRDTFGYVGDLFLDPKTYLISSISTSLAIRSYDLVNETSLRIGEYEDFKKVALDPYIAKRDAYHQNRKHKINEKGKSY